MTTRRQSLQMLGALLSPVALAAEETLKDLAARKGLRFGNAIGAHNKPDYRALMARECGVIVAENETKWQAVQPMPGPHRFEKADQLFAWAKENKMQIRGHTLVWQDARWLPAWINKGVRSSEEAERLLREHISAVCQHFGDSIYSYDVVNEAVNPADGALRSNVLTERLGALEEIDLAFRLAHENAPHAQLVYNDFMGPSADNARHRAGVLKLLADLKKRGTPIHALGLQSHIGGGDRTLRDWRAFLDEVSGMGFDLLITEFDVNDRHLPADITVRDKEVAALARDYLDLTLSYPRCRDFLLWGLADNVSWLQTWKEAKRADGVPMRPCPYDAKLQAKPLRTAIADALRSMPPRQI